MIRPVAVAVALVLALPMRSIADIHNDKWPAFSPDGRLVAFQRQQGTSADIYIVGVDGRGLRRMTYATDGRANISAAWLPGGRAIIYATTTPKATYPDGSFMSVSIDGGSARTIGPAGDRGHSISSDGRLLFLTRDWRIAQIDIASGEVSVLSKPVAGTLDLEGAWSPDARSIAFGCNYAPMGTHSDICVMNAAGGDRRVIAHRADCAEWPTWSPDGERIAFQADSSDFVSGAIAVVDLATGQQRTITSSSPYKLNETPSWSPDGTWIALQVRTPDGMRIALLHPDGSAFHLVT